MFDISEFKAKLYPKHVVFIKDFGFCTMTVEVYLELDDPRIRAYKEGGEEGFNKGPVTLFLSQIEQFIRKGKEMINKETDVKSKSKIVGVAKYPVYASFEEVKEGIGEEVGLSLINSQVRTNAMNEVRANATGMPTQAKLQKMAFAQLTNDIFATMAGDEEKLALWMDEKMEAILEEHKAKLSATEGTTGEETLLDDDDD